MRACGSAEGFAMSPLRIGERREESLGVRVMLDMGATLNRGGAARRGLCRPLALLARDGLAEGLGDGGEQKTVEFGFAHGLHP